MSSTADRIAPMSKRIENEAVYGELRRRIIDLDLAPGTRLREQNLADEFGISRTPIRRILDRLANDGLVSMSPGTGAAVSVVDFGALREVWAIRMKVAELLGDVIVLPAPARIALRGDVRSFDSATQDLIEARLEQLASGICLANGATHELTNNREFAATVNSAREATVVAEVVGADRVLPDHPPLMASEDFGFMLQEKPGAYAFIGNGTTGVAGSGLHSPTYDFNDEVLPLGAAFWTRLVETELASA